MATGSVSVVQVNNNQGAFKQVERTFLFIGNGGNPDSVGEVLPIGAQTDLDALLGEGGSDLKTQIEAARLNSLDSEWFGYAIQLAGSGLDFNPRTDPPYQIDESTPGVVYVRWEAGDEEVYIEKETAADGVVTRAKATDLWDNRAAAVYTAVVLDKTNDWMLALDAALEKPAELNIEAVVVCGTVRTKTDITLAQAAMVSALTKYAKNLTCFYAVDGIAEIESWSAYATRIKALITGMAADRVAVVPQLHGNNLGIVAGRLCNPAVTLADSPMRVATGALVGLGTAPVDVSGEPLTMAILKDLADSRFSVPQWYTGYDGIYWADHMLLDAESGDFQVYENRRVLDYLARRVRILAIGRVADRRLNSTAQSISANEMYFARPLREASVPVVAGGIEMPAMIKSPESDAVAITWQSKTSVAIAITAQPYNCPKQITMYLGLDLSN